MEYYLFNVDLSFFLYDTQSSNKVSIRTERRGEINSVCTERLKSVALWFRCYRVGFSRRFMRVANVPRFISTTRHDTEFLAHELEKKYREDRDSKGCLSALYIPRRRARHVAATVTPPHLLIVAMDTSATFPRNFPIRDENRSSRKVTHSNLHSFVRNEGHPRPKKGRDCVTFD